MERPYSRKSKLHQRTSWIYAEERASTLEAVEGMLQEIQQKDMRQYNMEVRLVQDATERRKLEKDMRDVQVKLQAVKGSLTSMQAGEWRRELLRNCDGDEGSEALIEASLIQDETQNSLTRMKFMINNCKNVGTSSLEALHQQRKVIEKINREANKGGDKLSRSTKLIKKFRRGFIFG